MSPLGPRLPLDGKRFQAQAWCLRFGPSTHGGPGSGDPVPAPRRSLVATAQPGKSGARSRPFGLSPVMGSKGVFVKDTSGALHVCGKVQALGTRAFCLCPAGANGALRPSLTGDESALNVSTTAEGLSRPGPGAREPAVLEVHPRSR